MSRRRALLAASQTGKSRLKFPLYLTSNEGTGKVRTIKSNETTLALFDYFLQNAKPYEEMPDIIELYFDKGQVFFDELEINAMAKISTNTYIDCFHDADYDWFIFMKEDGNIEMTYND